MTRKPYLFPKNNSVYEIVNYRKEKRTINLEHFPFLIQFLLKFYFIKKITLESCSFRTQLIRKERRIAFCLFFTSGNSSNFHNPTHKNVMPWKSTHIRIITLSCRSREVHFFLFSMINQFRCPKYIFTFWNKRHGKALCT